jgi:formylglycine-generating enzyme required for sulfatase activity
MWSRVSSIIRLGILALLVTLGACSSEKSNPVVTPQEEPQVQPPEFLHVTATDPGFIQLAWEDISEGERGFQVERATQPEGPFAFLDSLPPETEAYTDTSVLTGARYYYRLRTVGEKALSEPTEPVWGEAVTNATPETPADPQPPDGSRDLFPGITLSWSAGDPDGDPLQFFVYFSTSLSSLERVGIVEGTMSFVPPESLELNRKYFWRVQAVDPYGASALSPIWGFSMHIERIVVEEGYFFMGDTAQFRHPGNPVWVDAFSMDKYEVTNQQFADFLNEAARQELIRRESGIVMDIAGTHILADLYPHDEDSKIFYDTDRRIYRVLSGWENHPVIEVSWYGAKAFAEFYGRRLPTEAEWEKAARGTSTELGDSTFTVIDRGDTIEVTVGFGYPYPWGSDIGPEYCNYWESGDPFETLIGVGTTPVGFYDGKSHGGFATRSNASPYGIMDLAGNVYEWVEDWAGPYRSPHEPPESDHFKVIRGGSWTKGPGSQKTWVRTWTFPDSTDRSIGFRTVGEP